MLCSIKTYHTDRSVREQQQIANAVNADNNVFEKFKLEFDNIPFLNLTAGFKSSIYYVCEVQLRLIKLTFVLSLH